jgi:hypothetical protein
MGNAESAASIKLKHAFRSLGYSRHAASEYAADVRLAINKKFGRNFLHNAHAVDAKTLYRMITKGSLGVFTSNEIKNAQAAAWNKAIKLNKLFEDGALPYYNWIALRCEVRNFVCTWLANWLSKQESAPFKIRVMVARGELAASSEAEEVASAFDDGSVELSNQYEALAEITEEEDAAMAQALDAEVAQAESAEEAVPVVVAAEEKVQQPAAVQEQPSSDLVDNNPFGPLALLPDDEIEMTVVKEVAPVRVHQLVQTSPCFVHTNPFEALSLLDESLDGIEA